MLKILTATAALVVDLDQEEDGPVVDPEKGRKGEEVENRLKQIN